MNTGKALSIVMIVLSVGAAIAYLYVKGYHRAIYWGSAAILTSSVTF